MTARQWKDFYRRERENLGEAALVQMLDGAPAVDLPRSGAIIFPHTRLSASGAFPAAAARAVVESGYETILAIGVLHGAREQDAALVQTARGGDPEALQALRRIHGPDVAGDRGHWTEEFSLDNFVAFVSLAARRAKRTPPRVVVRFPFLVGTGVDDLPGIDELQRIVEDGAALVATTDPVHHGRGYDTPADRCLAREDGQTLHAARQWIAEGFDKLAQHDLAGFLANANAVRSDFRDAGPVVAHLIDPTQPLAFEIHDLKLVDYSDVLPAPPPTWVAAALATMQVNSLDSLASAC